LSLGTALYGDLYGTASMRAIFSLRSRLRTMLEVEVALARAEADTGVIPHATAEAIARAADVDRLVSTRSSPRRKMWAIRSSS